MIEYVKKERCGTTHCGKCNAVAPLYVLKPKQGSPGWVMYTICDKCKLSEFEGFMSEELKRNIDRRVELLAQWKSARTPAARGRIFAEVRKLSSSEETWNNSL